MKKLSRKYKIYNYFLLLFALFPLVLVGGLNILVDPYDIFKINNYLSDHKPKIKKRDHSRLIKAIDIIRIKPKAIFLGTSRTEQGLNPDNSNLNNYQPAYNLGLTFANIYEALRYLEHTIANQKDLKLVIIGVDDFMFNPENANKPDFLEARLEKKHLIAKDFINTTLSLDALSASWETLNFQDKNQSYFLYQENGMVIPPYRRDTIKEFHRVIKTFIASYLSVDREDFKRNANYKDFQKIVDICQQKNIRLIVFISPVHATQLEVIWQTDRWNVFEQWKRELVKIYPIWDFSGYNQITTEPLNHTMKNYRDSSHYTKEVGDLILAKILNNNDPNQKNSDFGILISPKNIETHLQKIRQDHQQWKKQNPEEFHLVETLRKQHP